MIADSLLPCAPDSPFPLSDSLPELAVIVPIRNEADNILPLIEEVHNILAGWLGFDLVCVDDGSTDATLLRLADVQRRHPRLVVLRHRRSCGQSQALITGIQATHARWIATLDGDGQNDPADIPVLFTVLQAMSADVAARSMIVGWRVKRCDSLGKRIASHLANRLRAALLEDETPDTGCGLKVFPRAAFLAFPHFDHMHRYLPALMIRAGGQVVSVQVNHRLRASGCSHYGILDRLWVGLFDLIGMMWLQRRSCRPEVTTLAGDALARSGTSKEGVS